MSEVQSGSAKSEKTERNERDQGERELKHLEVMKRLQTINEDTLKKREATETLKNNENDGGWKEREAMEELQTMGKEGAGRVHYDDAKDDCVSEQLQVLQTNNRSSLKKNERVGGCKEWASEDGWSQCKDSNWECDDEWEAEEDELVQQKFRPKFLWRPRSNSSGRNKQRRSDRTKRPKNAAAKPIMELRRGSKVVTSRLDVIPRSSASYLSQFELKAVQRTGTTLGSGAYGTVLLLKYKGMCSAYLLL